MKPPKRLKRRAVTPFVLAASAALAASILFACSDLAGLGDAPVVSQDSGSQGQQLSEGSDAAPPIDAGADGCKACIASSCEAQWTECAANSACAAYEDCIVPCGGDYTCRSRCLLASYASASGIPAMDQCVSAQCATECGLSCGMTSSYAEPDAAVACAQCMGTWACDSAGACGADLGCQRIVQCQLGCVTEDCFLACSQEADAAAASLDLSYVAKGESCAGPCGAGAFWDCSTTRPPPLSMTGQTVVTLNLVDVPGEAPVVGATVKACARTDLDCAQPVVPPATTDADGNVTFTLGALGAVGFSGYFDVSSPSVYPSLLFLSAPLSVPHVTFPAVLVPQPSFIQGMYASTGVTPDPSRGVLEVQAADCHFVPASGVTAQLVSVDAGADVGFAYFLNTQLSLEATSTDPVGYATLLGAPVGEPLLVSMTPLAVGHAVATVSLFARPGTWSFELARPQ